MAPDWLTAAAWLYPSVCFSGPQREWSDKSRRLFAAGDVRAGSTKRVAEGSASVRSVHEYLAFAH
jgi:hypothetical protein